MSAPPGKAQKQSSRWGGLLSGAVAGIESRLDTILAEDAQASAKSRAADAAAREAAKPSTLAVPAKTQPGSRSSSQTRPNSRLQERLAKAVQSSDSRPPSRGSSAAQSLPTSPGPSSDTVRTSIESSDVPGLQAEAKNEEQVLNLSGPIEVRVDARDALQAQDALSETDAPQLTPKIEQTTSPRLSQESYRSRPSSELAAQQDATSGSEPEQGPARTSSSYEAELAQLRQEREEESRHRQEEIHSHMERIDALQAKLQYLSKSAADAARDAATSASDPTEKKLAEKEEQIALLMEEGQKLSKTELKHMNTIKKLRAQGAEEKKKVADLEGRLAKAERNAAEARERARRAEAAEKQAAEDLKLIGKIEKDVDVIKAEREAAAMTNVELRRQLSEALNRAEEAEQRAEKGALEAERKAVADLKEQMADSQIEKKLVEDRARNEIREAKEEASRQQERANITEVELRGEIANLETKLEVLRSRTEEVSSRATSDSQTKLMRQIETLQTQYALASENWQGIETSLTSRVTALEKERDEISKREGDVRRKAREVNSKSRKLEEELESVNDRARMLEQDMQEQITAAQKLQTRLTAAESALSDARASFERDRKIWESELQQRIDEEKVKWRLEHSATNSSFPDPSSQLRSDSPTASYSQSQLRKQSHTDQLGHPPRRSMRIMSPDLSATALFSPHSTDKAPSLRRGPSAAPLTTRFSEASSSRQISAMNLNQLNCSAPGTGSATPSIPEAPSIHTIEPDDGPLNENLETSTSSPHRTINDLVSISTVGAGPSVQLVSRMSDTVRRLESEKASSREELARLATQRDEAREEVVSLMAEAEEKRALEERVKSLEEGLKEKERRYQTTLEMLGERQEECEELRNDVVDLKKIYRELVESTMK